MKCVECKAARQRAAYSIGFKKKMSVVMKLRDDIVISMQESSGSVVYVVKYPITGRFFRFHEHEAFILQQFDGNTSLQTIRERTEQKFNASLPEETLEQFAASVKRLCLCEEERTELKNNTKDKRLHGNLFFLRFRIFDPDILLEKLVKHVQFFFTKSFLVFSATAILFSLWITATSWSEIEQNINGLFQFFSLLFAWLILLTIVMLHEFAHGVTCKKFGGHVHEIGFLLIYFMPAFYCNVSDAWLFPEKLKRLLVTFAGGYFEIFLWSISTIIWKVTEPYTYFSNVALVVMATSGIKTLFNFNPLIKLDGYYLLSDYLEIPNLRQRAFNYLKNQIKSLFKSVKNFQGITNRERNIYLVYGVLTAVYTSWLISTFVFHFGNYLLDQYHGIGFIILLVFLTGLFNNQLKKIFSSPLCSLKSFVGNLLPSNKTAKVLLIIAIIACALFLIRMNLTVTGEFSILPVHNADVRAEVEEIIAKVYVEEGDTVKKGEPIVQLSDRVLLADLTKTKSEIAETEARLNLLKAGPTREHVALAKTKVEKAEERLQFAKKDVERSTILFDRGLIAKSEFEHSQEEAAIRQKEFEEEKNSLRIVLAGSRKEEKEALEKKIEQLVTQSNYYESQLNLLTVRSSTEGIIATPKLKEKAGQFVAKGDLIAKVFDLNTVTVEIFVSEKDIAEVKINQPVVVKVRAYPHLDFEGKVTAIAIAAEKENEWKKEALS